MVQWTKDQVPLDLINYCNEVNVHCLRQSVVTGFLAVGSPKPSSEHPVHGITATVLATVRAESNHFLLAIKMQNYQNVALHEVTWCVVYGVHRTCTKMAAVSCGTSHVTCQHLSTPLQWIFKNALRKASHSCRITCECSESAQESTI